MNYILTIVFVVGCGRRSDNEANIIRKIEQQRVRALVEENMDLAQKLHADDFQLITPDGSEFTKESYRRQVDTKELDYKVWDPGYITIQLYDNVAVI